MFKIAVITIDVINSTRLPGPFLERVMERLDQECRALKDDGTVMHYEIFRGDSLQLIVPDAEQSLRVAFTLKCAVNSIRLKTDHKVPRGGKITADIRFAIGIGETKQSVHNKMTNEEPFVRSGRKLDEIQKTGMYTGVLTGIPDIDNELQVELFLLEGITRKWTLPVVEVVYHKLRGKTEQVIAEELDISQSAVNQRGQSAYWGGLQVLLNRFEELIKGDAIQ